MKKKKKAKRCSLCHKKAGLDKHGFRIEIERTPSGRAVCDWCENECMEGVDMAEELGLIEVKRL